MVFRIKWTEKARADLREIRNYIAKDSRRYAEIQVEKIQNAAQRTVRHPKIGMQVRELPEEDWREILAGNYRIIYRVDEMQGRILILAVIHGKRLLKRQMVEAVEE